MLPAGFYFLAISRSANYPVDGSKNEIFNPVSSTLIKFKPATAKIISTARTCPVPLPAGERPAGPPHMAGSLGGEAWVQNAEWFYGGVGYAMFNVEAGCECWSRSRGLLHHWNQ